MEKYAKKMRTIGRILFAVAVISALTFFGGLFVLSQLSDLAIPLMFLSFYLSLALFIIYYIKFSGFEYTLKYFKENNREYCLEDINLTRPTFNQSKIYCGEYAFFCKKNGAAIAYDQVAWIYNSGSRSSEYVICLKSGKKLAVTFSDSYEYLSLFRNYIIPKNPETPEIIEGKTIQAKRDFLKRYPEAALNLNKGKIIGGSILLGLAIFALIFGIIRNTIQIPGLIVIGVLGASGLALLLYGLKNTYFVTKAASIQERLANSVFFNTVCKIGSVLAIISLILFFVCGALKLEYLLLPVIICYFIGMVFLMGSIFLRTGFFAKETPSILKMNGDFEKKTFGIPRQSEPEPAKNSETEYLDDVTFIREVKHLISGPWHQYDILLAARGYGWDMMKDWADYMAEADLVRISQVTTGSMGMQEKDITKSYADHGGKCRNTPELATEMGSLSIAGMSRTLEAPMKIVWINQTQVLRFFTLVNDELLIKKYVETSIRRTFGTEKAMKLGKPIPEGQ